MNNIKIPKSSSLGRLDFIFSWERTCRFVDLDMFFSLSTFKGWWSYALQLLPNRLERQEGSAVRTAERNCGFWWTKGCSVWERNRDLCAGGEHVTSCPSSARAVPFVSLLFWIFFKILIEPAPLHTPFYSLPWGIIRNEKNRDPLRMAIWLPSFSTSFLPFFKT